MGHFRRDLTDKPVRFFPVRGTFLSADCAAAAGLRDSRVPKLARVALIPLNVPRMKKRCAWAGEDSLYIAYHDGEWGVPSHDDRHLFEMLILEGAQAGLSWITILRKRENYRRAFANWDADKIATFGQKDVARLMADAGIVRNRLKISAAIGNAKAFLNVRAEFGSFDSYLWQFVGGVPIQNKRRTMRDVPARTRESDAMSRDLKQRGFRFVGTTICYALMQACGLVNDHLVTCPRHAQLGAAILQE